MEGRVRRNRNGDLQVRAEPLRVWLVGELRRRGMWDTRTGRLSRFPAAPAVSFEDLARRWGSSARKLSAVLYGEAVWVSDALVDSVFTGAGRPDLLAVEYPELGDLDDVAA